MLNQSTRHFVFRRIMPLSVCALLCMATSVFGYTDKYAGKQRVLMLGDSITMLRIGEGNSISDGIGWHVQEAFNGLANVHVIRNPNGSSENFKDTDYALGYRNNTWGGASNTRISSWIHGEAWDLIDFNTGLHDMRSDGRHDYPESYATKLGQVIDRIQADSSNATLIWRETTYVPNPETAGRHNALNGHPTLNGIHDDVQSYYNRAAAPVVAAKGITIVDKVEAISKFQWQNGGNRDQYWGDVHYNTQGSRAIAEVAIGNIFEQLDLDSGLRVDFGTAVPALEDNYYDYFGNATTSAQTRFVATDLADANNVVEISVAKTAGDHLLNFRRTANMSGSHSSLAEDYVAANAADGQGQLSLTIRGLAAGDYTFTGTFHDAQTDHGLFDVLLDTTGGSPVTVLEDKAYSTGSIDVDPASYSFGFTADGVNHVTINIDGENRSLINGLTITAIPEPATWILMLIGMGLLKLRR